MKNIKVNILNENGARSSTTINFPICEAYYSVAAGLINPPSDADIYAHSSVDEYIKAVSNCAQSYVNALTSHAVSTGDAGVSQYFIETNMLDQVINNQDI